VGSLANRHQDFKSPAYYQVPFKDMLFRDKAGYWAAYNSVSTSGTTVHKWMPQSLACATTSGRSFKMSAGNIKATGGSSGMQSTNVYFTVYDSDACWCGSDEDAYGPAWGYRNNNSCWPDDVGGYGWGPGPSKWGNTEGGRANLSPTKGYTTSESNSGDYIMWFVR
jgi:hypothetical protein